MSTEIPITEPTELRAGDTWKWRREDLASYPADSWTLKYRFKNASIGFEIEASADGVNHAIEVSAATTAAHNAGVYDWAAWVESGAEQYTIASGRLTVLANLRAGAAAAGLDLRSDARKYLDALKAALLARDPTLAAYTFQTGGGSRTKQFSTLAEVRVEYEKVQAEVAREDAAEAVAKGLGNPRRMFVRFGRA